MQSVPKSSAGDEFIPTRNSLLSRLKRWDDHEGWREFFDTYWKFLYCVALKAGLSDEDARDVVQETVIAVAKGLREGRFKAAEGGSFKWQSAAATALWIAGETSFVTQRVLKGTSISPIPKAAWHFVSRRTPRRWHHHSLATS